MRPPRAALLAAVLCSAALVSCSDDSSGDVVTPPGPGSTTTTAPSSLVVSAGDPSSPVPTTVPTPLPDGATAGACPALGPVPTTAQDLTQDVGDFDADQVLDALVAYRASGNWMLRVALSTGGGAEAVVPGVTGSTGITTLGGVDLGGPAGAEAFAVVGQGAATTGIGVFALEACQLVRVLGPDGQPAEFPVGGTVLNTVGLRCDDVPGGVQLSLLAATSVDGTTYTVSSQPLVLQGTRFVAQGAPAQATLTAPQDDGRLSQYARINCGGVGEAS